MHSFRICWMLCFCTNISQPFKLSSSSIVEEVAILSFKSVTGEKNRVDHERRVENLSGMGDTVLRKTEKEHVICDGEYSAKKNQGPENIFTV